MSLRLTPITVTDARRWMGSGEGRKHRHNDAPQGGLFAAAVQDGDDIVGVAIVGRPVSRMLDDGTRCEVTRNCTEGARNACSMLYGAAARAAKALGWSEIITYTLESEPGTSLRAAGFVRDAEVKAEKSHSRPGRPRVVVDLLGHRTRPDGPKVRWVRILNGKSQP